MNIVIVGCGRTGSALATKLDQAGHSVTIIDGNREAFTRLDATFGGTTVVGNGIDEQVLKRAGVEMADAFVALTRGDNHSIMASQIAREIFHVKHVWCRIYDPLRAQTYQELGLQIYCPTIVMTHLFSQAILGQ